MVLALTICDICPVSEVDMMISVLLNVFNTRASLLSLMKAMIEKEVATCGMHYLFYTYPMVLELFVQFMKSTCSAVTRHALVSCLLLPRSTDISICGLLYSLSSRPWQKNPLALGMIWIRTRSPILWIWR
jgi:hypothetical protein